MTATREKYPYIQRKTGRNPWVRVHITETLYIEINPQSQPSIGIVEHSDPNAGLEESITFEWEYHNIPNDCTQRQLFGRVDMFSSGTADVIFCGNYKMNQKRVPISELLKDYETIQTLKGVLERL
jgi:hypothetical protein